MRKVQRAGVRLYRVPEAAEQLGLATSTIYKAIEAGRMPCIRLGRAVRVSEAQLMEYVRLREDPGGAPRRGRR